MSRLHRQKLRQRFDAGVGAGNRDRDRAADVETFVARGQAAQAAVDKAIADAAPVKPARAKRAKRKAASARRRR